MKTTKFLSKLIFLTLAFILMGGCTQIHKSTKIFESYPQQEKINLVVQLVISDELKNAQIKDDFGLDVIVIDIGENLVANITKATKSAFTNVTISNTKTSTTSDDIILLPRLVLAKASYAQWKWDTGSIALGVEWTILNKNGKTIWVDTVEGVGSSKATIDDFIEVQLDMAIKEVSLNSYNTLIKSPVIRNLVK